MVQLVAKSKDERMREEEAAMEKWREDNDPHILLRKAYIKIAALERERDELERQLTEIGKIAEVSQYESAEAQQLAMDIEKIIDPIYCPKCGACGEIGCCPPDMCKDLPCLYGEGYLKSYHELEQENTALLQRVQELEKRLEPIDNIIVNGNEPMSYMSMETAINKCMELKGDGSTDH